MSFSVEIFIVKYFNTDKSAKTKMKVMLSVLLFMKKQIEEDSRKVQFCIKYFLYFGCS